MAQMMLLSPAAIAAISETAAIGRPRGRTFASVIGATLRTWRARARERAELAAMGERERHDLPFARGFDIRNEIEKPLWRE
jgi:uncharacterized protein YjiS (DUF1127 family)